jgi:hypothetical protein
MATITDSLGGSTSYGIRRINVTALSTAGLVSLLQQAQASLSTSQRVNASVFANTVLLAAEVATGKGTTAAPAVKDQVLSLLDASTRSQSTVDVGTASTMLTLLQRLSANLTATQAGTMLSVVEAVANRSNGITQQTGSSVLSTLEATLTSKSAASTQLRAALPVSRL